MNGHFVVSDTGITLVAGGPGPVEGFDRGYFVKPSVFSRLDPSATRARAAARQGREDAP